MDYYLLAQDTKSRRRWISPKLSTTSTTFMTRLQIHAKWRVVQYSDESDNKDCMNWTIWPTEIKQKLTRNLQPSSSKSSFKTYMRWDSINIVLPFNMYRDTNLLYHENKWNILPHANSIQSGLLSIWWSAMLNQQLCLKHKEDQRHE